jgi:putative endonuclease
MEKDFYVYILTSKKNGTLYIGVTSDLIKRVWQHKNKIIEGFANNYDVNRFVCFEIHKSIESALKREKQLKNWKRKWKIDLIEKDNHMWDDLYKDILPGS